MKFVGFFILLAEYLLGGLDFFGNVEVKNPTGVLMLVILYFVFYLLPTLIYFIAIFVRTAQINDFFDKQEDIYNNE